MKVQEIKKNYSLAFYGKHFLTLNDFTKEQIEYLIMLGIELKKKLKQGIPYQPLKGKTLGMIFEKSSTRTRVSFEVGMIQLGGHALFLNKNDLQLGRGETIGDTAKALSRYIDGIMMRTDSQEKLNEMAKNATIPVISGLSDIYHPTQAIADFMTIYEYKGKLQGLTLAYVGDGNNVLNSLLIGGSKLGININVASPKGFEPNEEIVQSAKEEAVKHGADIKITNDPLEAVNQADIIYTDVWVSMGQEEEKELRLKKFADYQVNSQLTKFAKKDYIFMHCLPAHREEEVATEIMDGDHSVVFDEAENRLHAHKAILTAFMG